MSALRDLRQRYRRRAQRALGTIRARHYLAGCKLGRGVCTTGRVRVEAARGAVTLGRNVVLRGGLVPVEFIATGAGEIVVGAASVLNYDVRLQALGANIVIGERCLIASGVRILSHGVRNTVIGNDVWIAHGAVIESDVHVGAGSVISAATIVTEDVPANSLVLGNPARIMPLSLVAGARAGVDDDEPPSSMVRSVTRVLRALVPIAKSS